MISGGKTVSQGAHAGNLIKELTDKNDVDQQAQDVLAVHVQGGATIGTAHREIVENAIANINVANFKRVEPGWHCWISPAEKMSEQQWARAWDIYEEILDLRGHSYLSVKHAKGARENHEHRYYDRSNADGKAQNIWQTKYRDQTARLIMEFEFGHKFTPFLEFHEQLIMKYLKKAQRPDVMAWVRENVRECGYADKAVTTQKERSENLRSDIPHADVATMLVEAWHESKNGAEFLTELAKRGLSLARGDRVDALMVTGPGITDAALTRLLVAGHKALGRKDEMPNAKSAKTAVDTKLADLDLANLPTLDQLRTPAKEAKSDSVEQRQADREIKAQDAAKAKPIKDPIKILSGESCVWSDSQLKKACLRAANGIHDKARELYQAAIKSSDLITVSMTCERWYTTRQLLEAERGLAQQIQAARGDASLAADPVLVATIIAEFDAEFCERPWNKAHKGLGADQINNVRHLTTSPDGIVAYSGVAGGGKTTSLEVAVIIWKAQNNKMFGVAPSGKAAINLKSSGITDCRAVHGMIIKLDREAAYRTGELSAEWIGHDGKPKTVRDEMISIALQARERAKTPKLKAIYDSAIRTLQHHNRIDEIPSHQKPYVIEQYDRVARKSVDKNSVVILDEAGMVDLVLMNKLTAKVRATGARLAMGGDVEQLQPVQAGAAFRLATSIIAPSVIDTVVRQREAWQREATSKFFSGKPGDSADAVRAYADHGAVKAGIAGAADLDELVTDAAKALGREITDEERQRIEILADYMGARISAGSIWLTEIGPHVEAGGVAEDHELYEIFRDAAERRDETAGIIESNIDDYRAWIARYGISREGIAADMLCAADVRRSDAASQAAAKADEIALLPESPDVGLKFSGRGAARADLIADWSHDLIISLDEHGGPSKSSLILAYNRVDVAKLNESARAEMRANGRLGESEVTFDAVAPGRDGEPEEHRQLSLSVGDRIQFLDNQGQVLDSNGKWVDGRKNGEFATVTDIEQKFGRTVLKLKVDDQTDTVAIDIAEYNKLALGYASTVHKSQGTTVDRTYVLASSSFERHLYYVAMTRHREFVKMYAAAQDFMNTDMLINSAMRERTADLISDHVDINTIPTDGIETTEDRVRDIRGREKAEQKPNGAENEKSSGADEVGTRADKERVRASPSEDTERQAPTDKDSMSDLHSRNTAARERRDSEDILQSHAPDRLQQWQAGSFRRGVQRGDPGQLSQAVSLSDIKDLSNITALDKAQATTRPPDIRSPTEINAAVLAAAARIWPDLMHPALAPEQTIGVDEVKPVAEPIATTPAPQITLRAIKLATKAVEKPIIVSPSPDSTASNWTPRLPTSEHGFDSDDQYWTPTPHVTPTKRAEAPAVQWEREGDVALTEGRMSDAARAYDAANRINPGAAALKLAKAVELSGGGTQQQIRDIYMQAKLAGVADATQEMVAFEQRLLDAEAAEIAAEKARAASDLAAKEQAKADKRAAQKKAERYISSYIDYMNTSGNDIKSALQSRNKSRFCALAQERWTAVQKFIATGKKYLDGFNFDFVQSLKNSDVGCAATTAKISARPEGAVSADALAAFAAFKPPPIPPPTQGLDVHRHEDEYEDEDEWGH